jgi:hypothetical protein
VKSPHDQHKAWGFQMRIDLLHAMQFRAVLVLQP